MFQPLLLSAPLDRGAGLQVGCQGRDAGPAGADQRAGVVDLVREFAFEALQIQAQPDRQSRRRLPGKRRVEVVGLDAGLDCLEAARRAGFVLGHQSPGCGEADAERPSRVDRHREVQVGHEVRAASVAAAWPSKAAPARAMMSYAEHPRHACSAIAKPADRNEIRARRRISAGRCSGRAE